MGNLCNDVELKYSASGTAIGNFSVAVNEKWKKDGVEQEHVNFIEVTAFGKTAETIADHLGKGSPIFIEGKLKQERWEDKKTQQKRSKVKIDCWRFQFIGKGEQKKEPTKPDVQDEEIPF